MNIAYTLHNAACMDASTLDKVLVMLTRLNVMPTFAHTLIAKILIHNNAAMQATLNVHYVKFLQVPTISYEQVKCVLEICKPLQANDKVAVQQLVQMLLPRSELLGLLLEYSSKHNLIIDLSTVTLEKLVPYAGTLCNYLSTVALNEEVEIKYRPLVLCTLQDAVNNERLMHDALSAVDFLSALQESNMCTAYEMCVKLM